MTKITAGALFSLILVSFCGCGRNTASTAVSPPTATPGQVAAKSQPQPAPAVAKSPEITVLGTWHARAANGLFMMIELENTSGRPIRAFRGKLTQVDDFGAEEVIAPYEFTSQSKYAGDGTASQVSGHTFADGETMVRFETDYLSTGEAQILFLDKKIATAILSKLDASAEFAEPKAGVRFKIEQVAYANGN